MYSPTKKNTEVRMGLNNKSKDQVIAKRKTVVYGTRILPLNTSQFYN